MFIGNKKCRIYAACGVSQTPSELLLCEDSQIQKTKILKMTDGILKDLTTSWETVCYCYNELIREK